MKIRRDDVLITLLRSGYHLLLNVHHYRIDPEIDSMSPSCQQAEHTQQHWLFECQM